MKRILIAAGLALAAVPAIAEETGQQDYMVACAICQGESGKGDGPFAPILSITTHGDSAMPIWGERFKESAAEAGPYGSELEARGRLLALVTYLETIQE